MKPFQKVVTLVLVLVLALAAFGLIAGPQATHAQMTAQNMPAPAQASELQEGGPVLAFFILDGPVMVPNVSWNS